MRRATPDGRRCAETTVRSAVASIPPLKPTIGAVMPRGAINMRKPRGGRLLIIEKSIPFARSAAAAAFMRSVRTFSLVTNVPSTSEITAEHLIGRERARVMTIYRHRHRRPATSGHLSPTAHRPHSARRFPRDRSTNPPRSPWPKHQAPIVRCAKSAPPCPRA